jgi:hypothetical protein
MPNMLSCYGKKEPNKKESSSKIFVNTTQKVFNPIDSKEAQIRPLIDNAASTMNLDKFSISKNSELKINQNDFLKKFNTSDAIRPPRIFLDINNLFAANSDQHLLVTAEMENSNKNINVNRLGGSNFMSNNRSNISTSNDDSKELLNFNSKESNNPNNINLNYFNSGNINKEINNNKNINKNVRTFNSKNSGNSNSLSNNIPINFDSNKGNNKYSEDKDCNFNLDPKLSKFNSQNNSNINKSSNSNFSFKTKQSQKNQIFFPMEVSVKSFNSANSVNNKSNKTISDFPSYNYLSNFNTSNTDKNNNENKNVKK